MRPQWIEPPLHRDKPARDLLLLVDLSGSMDTKDFTDPAGAKVDRLTAVKQVLDEFLARREGRPRRRRGLRRCALHPGALHHRSRSLPPAGAARCRSAWPARAPPSAMRSGSASTCSRASTVPATTMIALTDGNDTGEQGAAGRGGPRGARPQDHHPHRRVGDPDRGRRGQARRGRPEGRRPASPAAASTAPSTASQLADIYRRLDQIETRKVDTVSFRAEAPSSSGCRCWSRWRCFSMLVQAPADGALAERRWRSASDMSALRRQLPPPAPLGACFCSSRRSSCGGWRAQRRRHRRGAGAR